MKTTRRLFAALIVPALMASTAQAIDFKVLLAPKAVRELPAEALPIYSEAVMLNDYVNYDEVVLTLAKAAEAAPEHVEIQFLTLSRALDRGKVYYSSNSYTPPPATMDYSSPPWRTAEPFFAIAEACLNRLQGNGTLTDEERRRVDREAMDLETNLATITQRDAARMEVALPFLVSKRRNLLVTRGMEAILAQEDQERAQEAGIIVTETEEGTVLSKLIDPFAALYGEARESFLPPPPVQATGGQGRNPFNDQPGGPEDLPGGPGGTNPFDQPPGGDPDPAELPPPPAGGDNPF